MKELRSRLRREAAVCVLTAVTALLCNFLLLARVTEETYAVFLWGSILLDTAAGWFILTFWGVKVKPEGQRCRLLQRAEERGVPVTGVLNAISTRQRVGGLDCVRAVLTTAEGERTIYLPLDWGALPEAGEACRFTLVDNIAVSWEKTSWERS